MQSEKGKGFREFVAVGLGRKKVDVRRAGQQDRTSRDKREDREQSKKSRQYALSQESEWLNSRIGKLNKPAIDLARAFIVINGLFIAYPKFAEARGTEAPPIPRAEQLTQQNQAFHVEAKKQESLPEAAKQINAIAITAIRDGAPVYYVINQEDLGASTSVAVDGYLSTVIVSFGDASASVTLNGKNGEKGRRNGNFLLYQGGMFMQDEIASPALFSKDAQTRVFGYDTTLNPEYRGQPLSEQQKNTLRIMSGGESFTIPITQKTAEPMARLSHDVGTASVGVEYLGTRPERMQQQAEKLKATQNGIHRIEEMFNLDLVDRLRIVDYDKNDAFIYRDPKETKFTILTKALEERPADQIKTIAEHEVLHKAIIQRGYAEDKQLREIFADVHQAEGKKREYIVKHGVAPSQSLFSLETNPVFGFMNEEDYFGMENLGHASEDIDEFLASFLHTIESFDRFENRLASSVHSTTSSIDEKPGMQELPVLRVYDRVLSRLTELAPASSPERERYQQARDRIGVIIASYQ